MKSVLDLSFTAAQLSAPGTYKNDPKESLYTLATSIIVIASLQGLTGGTLDVVIQDSIDGAVWYDYLHFAQLAAGAAAINILYSPDKTNALATVSKSVDPANPTITLAAGTGRGGPLMSYVRAVAIAGAGTSAGSAQSIQIVAR